MLFDAIKTLFSTDVSEPISLQDINNQCASTFSQHASTIGDLSFTVDTLSMKKSAASYSPSLNRIVLHMSPTRLFNESKRLDLHWSVLLDAVLCHEMGHAMDPQVAVYCSLMDDASTEVERDSLFKEYAMQLELNAEQLGMQFTQNPEAFTQFNKDNQAVYRGLVTQ